MLLGTEPELYAGHGERNAYVISDYIGPELGPAVDALTQGDFGGEADGWWPDYLLQLEPHRRSKRWNG